MTRVENPHNTCSGSSVPKRRNKPASTGKWKEEIAAGNGAARPSEEGFGSRYGEQHHISGKLSAQTDVCYN